MTLRPEQIGDRGQRYEVRATGYPKKEKSVVGWSHDKIGALRLAAGISLAPGCTSTEVFDRLTNQIVVERNKQT